MPLRFLSLVIVLCFTLALPRARAETSQTLGLGDLAKITDPATRKAVDELAVKIGAIHEYRCVLHMQTTAKGETFNPFNSQLAFRQPNLRYHLKTDNTPKSPSINGRKTWYISDGHKFWNCYQGPRGTQPALSVTVTDLDRLRQAGAPNDLDASSTFVEPFSHCDPATLKLTASDPQTVTFTAGLQPPMGAGDFTIELKFDRSNGTLRSKTIQNPTVSSTEQFTTVILNPTPALADSVFTFQVPAGITAKDNTEELIKAAAPQPGK